MSGTGQARRTHRRRGGVQRGLGHQGDAEAAQCRWRLAGTGVGEARRHEDEGGSASDRGDESMGNREREGWKRKGEVNGINELFFGT